MRKAATAVLVVAISLLAATAYQVWATPVSHNPGSSYFWDVAPGSVTDEHIGFLAEAGVTQGFPDGSYGPTLDVSREQMAVYLTRLIVSETVYTWLVIDDVYFGGYYFGWDAYQQGEITYDEYLDTQARLAWLVQLMDFTESELASPTSTSAEAHDSALLHQAARHMARLRDVQPPMEATHGDARP